jgi:hypothetical protein
MLTFLLANILASRSAPPPAAVLPPVTPAPAAPATRPGVVTLDPSVLDGCSDEAILFTASSLGQAINVGAPVYNTGDHAGCYHQYLGTATDLVQRLPQCAGVRNALSAGIGRAAGATDYTDAAWVMRDTFDSLLAVMEPRLEPLLKRRK